MDGQLPNFLIVGMAKSGTTSLADWLRAHPQAFVADTKEIHFFDDEANWARGADWYARHFAAAGAAAVVGEATPFYMYFPDSVTRMADTVPGAKLIAILRDPVDRTFSNWRHVYYRMVTEHRSFPQLIDDELREGAAFPGPGEGTRPERLRHLLEGLYLEQLERVLARYERERLLVVLTDDLESDPVGTFAQICRFLEIDDDVMPPVVGTPSNVHFEFRPVRLWRFFVRHRILMRLGPLGRFVALKVMRREGVEPPTIDPETRELLARYYAEPNARLAEWLGRELPWTKPSDVGKPPAPSPSPS